MNEITNTGNGKVYFSIDENSNYKVLMTYDRVEIIEFGHYKKLMKVLNSADVTFVTINQRLVNKSTIIDISPTNEKTSAQKAEAEKAREEAKKRKIIKEQAGELRVNFVNNFFNNLYGVGKWRYWLSKTNSKEPIHLITVQDYEECWEAFSKKFPDQAKLTLEIEEDEI